MNFRSSLVSFILALLIPVTASASNEKLEQATKALEAGQPAQAIELLATVIDDGATSLDDRVRALSNRGSAQMMTGNYDAAVADFSRAIESKPDDATLYLQRAIARAQLNDRADASSDFDRALELNPKYPEAHYSRGLFYQRQDELDAAVADYSVALTLNPKMSAAAVRLAKIHASQGNMPKAFAVLNESLAVAEEPMALVTRGNLFLASGNGADALVDYTRSVEIDPKFAPAYVNRGMLLYQMGAPKQAIIDLDKALQLEPDDPQTLNHRGNAYRMLDRVDEALRDFSKVVALAPEDSGVRFNLANIHMMRGDVETSIRELTTVMESGTGPDEAQYYRGLANLTLGNLAAAKGDLETYVSTHPDDAYPAMMLYITVARIGEDAEPVLALRLKEKPEEWTDHLIRRLAGVSTDEQLMATIDASSPAEAAGQLCEAHYYLGQLSLIAGKPSAAKQHFEAAVATKKTNFIEHQGAAGELRRMAATRE